jgi:hypothetical protein
MSRGSGAVPQASPRTVVALRSAEVRTAPVAIPVRGGPLAATSPLVENVYPQVPPPPPPRPALGPTVHEARAIIVPPPPALPSTGHAATVPAARFVPTVSTTRQRGSSFLLGVLTFFLVLASLAIVAWLTMPYWRTYVEL